MGGSFASDAVLAPQPMPDAPRSAIAASPSMYANLAQRKREVTRRCVEEAMRLNQRLLFGMTTSLMLQQVPLPASFDLDPDVLHTVSSTKTRRVRKTGAQVQPHVWKHMTDLQAVKVNQHVYALELFHTWAQMASHMSFEDVVILGCSILEAKRRQLPARFGNRADELYRALIAFVEQMPRFTGKTACRKALGLVMPNVSSPQEARCNLLLRGHGVPKAETNYIVPDAAFKSGALMTLDMAWPEYRVAVEYDGDHHRGKDQRRRAQEKRNFLRSRGWVVLIATGAIFASEQSQAEFAFAVARELAQRGAQFDFRVMVVAPEQLI